ncbi:tRNA (5-methylaminomethyl-2-thiouridylate)-methyltransferase [Sulfurimonas denitrificans DSM 1251]|uniref:tRNA-specific 2-thiouridylase MnmA n=1 Tax=Sulfurimonas denitrificans (strain ATCC 33889 / DSM 1251) TaxID=326298 RepID=MNMA_SULDN|nr:tRNA 2-thiouridine(34) synthase MnmA [Sulfurimonas denitrificans]Q30SP2.1 RecName: Full=tRNA-specific 2-thiouridylase MnmA [Sulfurimonas denitrificans DSM 1251]ABB43989.1 tRNA (5-methylaminomethyl-2-thiouridylate)-methyltransferase [Sulfurimonas denitrificans DSM 1251]MDD3443261.1 tRNA 2-thiouridine(34) synthase MnmA [Sulfurimonas denitrificans]
MSKKVLLGMSGGVDSTVSAMFLKEEGYEVEGLYMKLHSNPGYHEIHEARARKAADFLGIKLHVIDLQEIFNEKVFKPFVDTYAKGKTPNPCALCNRSLKFGEMLKFAYKIGADFVATGHYIKTDGKYFYEADDDTKDQSYFLFYVNKEILPRLLFPLGDRKKSEIKELAASINGLATFASQRESSEICFVETTYTDLLQDYVEVDKVGEVLDTSGKVVGEHKGYMHYTIGKRRGFSVNGAHDPHYVVSINPDKNQIIVGKKEDLACNSVVLNNLNLYSDEKSFDTTVKLRYRTKAIPCHVDIIDDKAHVTLKESVFGVAVGQAAVFYDGNKLLGGGWIEDN